MKGNWRKVFSSAKNEPLKREAKYRANLLCFLFLGFSFCSSLGFSRNLFITEVRFFRLSEALRSGPYYYFVFRFH